MSGTSAIALIQGASRGIGLQFCKTLLLRNSATTVVATCRDPNSSSELAQLKVNNDRLHVCKLDVTKENDISDVSKYVTEKFGKLDLLINCAGMLHPSGKGETSLRSVDGQDLLLTLHTNAVGPLLMAKMFSPLLLNGNGQFGVLSADPKATHCGIIANMSAKVGSITDNGLGGWYSYRMSKAALNMATKNLSIEFGRGRKKIICVSLHPGTVNTDLSRPYHKNVPNLFTTEYSVDCLLKVIDSLTVEDSGKFFTYDRTVLPY
ncbi:C-signal-like [Saccostrea echinata]|uniref:C-signal-like n=1 Tax=Saccostrea echinata TaxID=191078 RepID=UPI002A8210B3|nr:C-signal-like [Saccostrea echinata]